MMGPVLELEYFGIGRGMPAQSAAARFGWSGDAIGHRDQGDPLGESRPARSREPSNSAGEA
jgi:hypothetical protein